MRLLCPVKHYDWGEVASDGHHAYIADLLGVLPGDEPWAELWIGAHPSASSLVENTRKSLYETIAEGPEAMLGEALVDSGNLPFLLKILCCSKALSIQSHPDLATAARLHLELPKEFPDSNHKPEVLLAISEFEVMAGFRSVKDALADIRSISALSPWTDAVGDEPSIRELSDFILHAPHSVLEKMAEGCRDDAACLALPNGRLFQKLEAAHHADCGAFFAFILNYFTLNPGEAIFIGPNIPHAYLCGRGVECMANSDNVIRAGLTKKYVNKQILMETLVFDSRSPEQLKVQNKNAAGFDFACGKDFRLQIIRSEYIPQQGTPAVFIVLDGSAKIIDDASSFTAERGSMWFLPAKHFANSRIVPQTPDTCIAMASGVLN